MDDCAPSRFPERPLALARRLLGISATRSSASLALREVAAKANPKQTLLVDVSAMPVNAGVPLSFTSSGLGAEEFWERLASARRSGNPAWLWPEVPVTSWAAAMADLGEAIAVILGGEEACLGPGNPMALSLACYTSGVGPLLGWWMQEGLVSAAPDIGDLLRLHLEQSRLRTLRTSARSREIVSSLSRSGAAIVVLKGGHTSYDYFPDPATRPASDLDLLVPRGDSERAQAALAEEGFQCVGRSVRESNWSAPETPREPRSLWLVHADDPWSIDLHSSLDFSAGPGAPAVKFDLADPFFGGESWALAPEAATLRQPLLLLHLAVHASGGLHSLTLLRMIEIILVVRQDLARDQLSWDEFLSLGAQIGALGGAYPALCMCEKLSPGTIPPGVLRLSAELAPRRVRAIVEKLGPATIQRVERSSIAEHFMWTGGLRGWFDQIGSDLFPRSDQARSIWSIYQARAYRLLRRRISR